MADPRFKRILLKLSGEALLGTLDYGTDGIEFFGHSFISDPFGRILAEAGTEPAVLVAKCDRTLIESTRRNWPFLRDRRIDAYAPILSRYIG